MGGDPAEMRGTCPLQYLGRETTDTAERQQTGCPPINCSKTIKFSLISTKHFKSGQGDISAPTTGHFFLLASLAHYL